jgi:phage baseplate assembly protein W
MSEQTNELAVRDFVGAGLSFPLRLDTDGSFALSRGDVEIAESIRLVLGTAFGERPMRPEFGCAIHDMVFDPADAGLSAVVAYEVRASLVRWEPRIDVLDVSVDLDPEDQSCVWISISWSLRDANDPRNLVYPFYVIPGEG